MSLSTSVSSSAFGFERQMREIRFRRARLAAREWLTPEYVRVRVEGADLAGFESPGSDDHMRLFFPEEGAQDAPASVEEFRARPSREYTPLAWGEPDDGLPWLEIEFAIHGAAGLAAPWAANAPIGAEVGIGGPRGSRIMQGRPDAWLLAGDETAVPAIRRFAWSMDADATGRILIEVPDADRELPVEAPAGVEVTMIHRGDALAGSALITALDAIAADERPTGAVFGFAAAEQSIVKPARALLLERWGLTADETTIKGYWKRGEDEYHAPH